MRCFFTLLLHPGNRDRLPSAIFCKFILMFPRQIHKIDDVLSRKPVVAVGGKDSLRHDADGLRSGQAGLQFLCVSDTYGNACPMKRQEEVDRLNRPGLCKTGHYQIVAMLILLYEAVDVGAVAAPAYLPRVAGPSSRPSARRAYCSFSDFSVPVYPIAR